jgi:hypothetical protein
MFVRSWFVLLTFSLLTLSSSALCRSVQAQDSGSTATWWNPMSWGGGSSDSGVRKSTYFNGESKKEKSDKPMFSLPTIPWASTEKEVPAATAPKASSGPTLLGRMGQSTRQAWHNTADFLNPFNDGPASKPQSGYQPAQQGYQPQNLNKTTTSGSGMFGWMWREEKTEQPASVNDFLRQERPRF